MPEDKSDHIILSYGFDGRRGGEPLSGDEISRQIKDDKFAWVHLNADSPNTRKWLKEEVGYLDNFIIDALVAEETRPRMSQIGEGVLLIFRGVNLNKDAHPEDMISIRMWVDKHRVISLTKRQLESVNEMERRIQHHKGPKDAGEFIGMILSFLFERMEPVLADLNESIDLAEEGILEHADLTLRDKINQIRRNAIIFKRYLAPQREAVNQLRLSDLDWLKDMHRRHFLEAYNNITRYVEDLDAIRERAQIVKDELSNLIANNLNSNMYVLSVIAAIFLPLGFLTGLLGVNIGGIPGGAYDYAFLIFCALLVVLVGLQIYLFRKFKWI